MKDNIIRLKFDGEVHDINLVTFSITLKDLNTIISEINKEINSQEGLENAVEVRVKALSKGSFEIFLELYEFVSKNIFTSAGLQNTANIIIILSAIFGIRKFLKKQRRPSKIEKTGRDKLDIYNNKNEKITINNITYNIYEKNPYVYKSLNSTFNALNIDDKVKGFNIFDVEDKPLFNADKSDFKDMSETVEYEDEESRVLDQVATLNIIRVSFDKKLKWTLYYNGTKIPARVTDPSFQSRIEDGEKFAKGDLLEVDLKIRQEFDKSVNTYVNKSYEIVNIIKHIPRAELPKLF